MSLKHGILGLLSYNSMTGYDLMKYFNESLKFFWNAQTSQIYRELNNLEKKGFVKSDIVYQENKPNKRVYTITKNGKAEFLKWLNEYSLKESVKVRNSFLMRVFFSANADPDKLIEALLEYKKYNVDFLKSLEVIHKKLDTFQEIIDSKNEKLFWELTLRNGIISAEGNIKWVEEAISKIKNLKGDDNSE
ncbi:PadR family transcriptional regulator [Caloranaerobacter sp. DY30410]|uniref:PadR family transcriptional regulator n=1 Tax=Caloranaerobacter sp. DY30410 TaxID=3238305 RepID=UPI003D01BCE4